MYFSLPAERPESVFRYTFEHFIKPRDTGLPYPATPSIVPLEMVAPGDVQVLAAHEPNLDILADFPSVESVVASTAVRAGRELPHIRELLLSANSTIPPADTLRRLSAMEVLYALHTSGRVRLDLESLPAAQMRKLAVIRWLTGGLAPLERMTGLRSLWLDLFREPLDAVSRMPELRYLSVIGPAKGWARLRECTLLEEAHLIEVQIANLRRWNTWQALRALALGGRGVKSLRGLEQCERLGRLTLLNLPMQDLSPLRELPRLHALTLRMVAENLDLASIATAPALRSLAIDSSARDVLHVPSLRTLARASGLEEVLLLDTVIDDGDLMPLADLPKLRRVRLGSMIGADVEKLRAARSDIEIIYTPPDPKWAALREQVGGVTIQRPGEDLEQWSIFQSFAFELRLSTNYGAEKRIKEEVKRRDPALARRLTWDTEAGAVGIYAKTEADIRSVAEIVNEMLNLAARNQH